MLRLIKSILILIGLLAVVGWIAEAIESLKTGALRQQYKRLTGSKQYTLKDLEGKLFTSEEFYSKVFANRVVDAWRQEMRRINIADILAESSNRCESWCNDPHCQGECNRPMPCFCGEVNGVSFCSDRCKAMYESEMDAMAAECEAERRNERWFEERGPFDPFEDAMERELEYQMSLALKDHESHGCDPQGCFGCNKPGCIHCENPTNHEPF